MTSKYFTVNIILELSILFLIFFIYQEKTISLQVDYLLFLNFGEIIFPEISRWVIKRLCIIASNVNFDKLRFVKHALVVWYHITSLYRRFDVTVWGNSFEEVLGPILYITIIPWKFCFYKIDQWNKPRAFFAVVNSESYLKKKKNRRIIALLIIQNILRRSSFLPPNDVEFYIKCTKDCLISRNPFFPIIVPKQYIYQDDNLFSNVFRFAFNSALEWKWDSAVHFIML